MLSAISSSISVGETGLVCKQKSTINSFLLYIKQAIKENQS